MSPILWTSIVISLASIVINVFNILAIRRSHKRMDEAYNREGQALDNLSRELDKLIKKGR